MSGATTPANAAISCSFSALRRMTISGSDGAITLIMNASMVTSAAPSARPESQFPPRNPAALRGC
jgi:hypothetical protein